MVKRILFLFFILLTTTSYAQQRGFSITLKLVEEGTSTPIEFATVSLNKVGSKDHLKYVLSDDEGNAKIEKIRKGKYTVTAELLGYKSVSKEVEIVNSNLELGTLEMKVETEFLESASVSAVGNPIVIKKDTIEYSASSFKTTDNDMLEDLLKKLPGIEIGEDGKITAANGKEITKITIDGKTFFLDDPQIATKNIPANIVEKVKVLEKKSEQAEFTGIDDGEEETVIDLSIYGNRMNGWFGNSNAGGGYDIRNSDNKVRYQGAGMVANFTQDYQLSLIANANNTNNRGFNDMAGSMMGGMRGGGMRMGRGGGFGGGGNGERESYMIGANAAYTFDKTSELAGNYFFSGNESLVEEKSSKVTLKQDGSSLLNDEDGSSMTNGYNHNISGRLDWDITDQTSILFMPRFNIGYGSFLEENEFASSNQAVDGSIEKVNDGNSLSTGDNDYLSTSGTLLLRQRLGKPGRTLSLRVNYSLSNNELLGKNYSLTNVYKGEAIDSTLIDQTYTSESDAYSLGGRLNYTEPLGNDFFIEASYGYTYSFNNSVKNTFDKDINGNYTVLDSQYSNDIQNTTINQRAGLSLNKQGEKYNITIGANAQPYKTTNVTNGKTFEREVVNFAPNARIDYDFSNNTSLRVRYRGNTNQPSMNQLQPVEDNSNPLAISRGNPGLTPSFNHRLNVDYRTTNMDNFASTNISLNATYNPNSIVNASWYDSKGVQYSVPLNNNKGTYNTSARVMFNSPIAKSKFSIMTMTFLSYSNSMSFVGKEGVIDGNDENSYLNMDNYDENKYQTVSINENLRFTYRDDLLEFIVGGRIRYSKSWYEINTREITPTWSNNIYSTINYTPNLWAFKTDVNYNFFRGYDEGYNEPTFILNASVSRRVLKEKATIELKAYDILNQSKNTYRTVSDNYIKDVTNNSLGRYVILSFTYRFGNMGGPKGGPMGGRGPGRGMGRGPR